METGDGRRHPRRLHAAARQQTPTSSGWCEAIAAACQMHTELVLRFDYGRTVPWVSRLPDGTFRAIAGPDMVVASHTGSAAGRGSDDCRRVRDRAEDQTIPFVLTHGSSHLAPPADNRSSVSARQRPRRSGRRGPTGAASDGEWDDAVVRSLITLKALTYAPTGGMVAAPTTSVPERLGGVAELGLPVLLAARRHAHIARADERRLLRRGGGVARLAAARRGRSAGAAPDHVRTRRRTAADRSTRSPGCPATKDSRPVRIGNAAHDQLQLDVYGEVMDALHQAREGGLTPREADWAFQRALLEHLESGLASARTKGMWEIRGEPRHFTYSKVMAWVALDRGIRAAETLRPGRIARSLAGSPSARCTTRCASVDSTLRSEASCSRMASKELDASLLLMATDGIPAAVGSAHPRHHRGGRAPTARRRVCAALRHRDRATMDCPEAKARFSPCSVLAGRRLRAAWTRRRRAPRVRETAEAAQRRRSAVRGVRHVTPNGWSGNFPQAFSHIALINTAHNLSRATKPAHQRSS